MSGGVDSSVAAALCVGAGHRVLGVMLRLWAEETAADGANRCCAPDALADAAAVAETLGIPFSVIDARERFKSEVVDRFTASSAVGDTPNPCLGCNRRVRFGFLLDRALALGADALVTGHYARLAPGADGDVRLLRGVDREKDQSYVLSRLDQDQLARARFPLGEMHKSDVRRMAEEIGLHVSGRSDSVDLCWTGDGGVSGFLARHLPPGAARPGPIVDTAGRQVGEHRGLPYYTLGQRRGLGLSQGRPVYVVGRSADLNELVVGPAAELDAVEVPTRDVHWISGVAPDSPIAVTAQVRYRAPAAPAEVVVGPGRTAVVRFAEPQLAPTPGQAVVFYDGDECLGGGIIASGEGG